MGLSIACERRSEEDAANRLNSETLNSLEGVSWGEFTQAQTEIASFFSLTMTEVNLEWKRQFPFPKLKKREQVQNIQFSCLEAKTPLLHFSLLTNLMFCGCLDASTRWKEVKKQGRRKP